MTLPIMNNGFGGWKAVREFDDSGNHFPNRQGNWKEFPNGYNSVRIGARGFEVCSLGTKFTDENPFNEHLVCPCGCGICGC